MERSNINYYTIDNFPYDILSSVKVLKRKRGIKSKVDYYDIVTAFDIETSNIDSVEQAVMYIWQWQITDEITVIGRKWSEFISFYSKLNEILNEAYIVVLVHNLSFEWQWLKSLIPVDFIFPMDDRKVLYFRSNNLEFRCTYIHSNMKLEKYIEKMGSPYLKVKDFDYSKKRYYFTPLTDEELEYCIMDVKGLRDAYIRQMTRDNDDLYTIAYTSTGYVRKPSKEALRPYRNSIKKMLPNEEVFHGLRKAFRGG